MIKSLRSIALLPLVLLVSAVVAAPPEMSRAAYASSQARIASEYKETMDYCGVLEGNTREVCAVEAESKRKVDLANLEAAYRPSFESTQAAAATTVDATYAIALKRCNDKSAADRAACLGEAQSERRIARANADILEDNVQPARGPRARSSGAGKPPKRADRQKP